MLSSAVMQYKCLLETLALSFLIFLLIIPSHIQCPVTLLIHPHSLISPTLLLLGPLFPNRAPPTCKSFVLCAGLVRWLQCAHNCKGHGISRSQLFRALPSSSAVTVLLPPLPRCPLRLEEMIQIDPNSLEIVTNSHPKVSPTLADRK